MKMNPLDKIATLLLIIGGFNWGLVGWLDYNLVDSLFGVGSAISRVVYAIVGMAALVLRIHHDQDVGQLSKQDLVSFVI